MEVPVMLLEDASWQNQLILQYLSRTRTPWQIDGEVGNLSSDLLTPEPALSYLRYNAWLTKNGLDEIDMGDLAPHIEWLRSMSGVKHLWDLARIGEKAAAKQILEEHFPPAFDLNSGGLGN
jgi:hypothetical protein